MDSSLIRRARASRAGQGRGGRTAASVHVAVVVPSSAVVLNVMFVLLPGSRSTWCPGISGHASGGSILTVALGLPGVASIVMRTESISYRFVSGNPDGLNKHLLPPSAVFHTTLASRASCGVVATSAIARLTSSSDILVTVRLMDRRAVRLCVSFPFAVNSHVTRSAGSPLRKRSMSRSSHSRINGLPRSALRLFSALVLGAILPLSRFFFFVALLIMGETSNDRVRSSISCVARMTNLYSR